MSKPIFMHCRIRVADYRKWRTMMVASRKDHQRAGLRLIRLWRGLEDPNLEFFIMEAKDMKKAREHLNPADVKKASAEAAVIEFEWDLVSAVAIARPKSAVE